MSLTDLPWSNFSQECLEISAVQKLKHDVVRPSVEADSDQLHDVRVIELAGRTRTPQRLNADRLSE